MALDPNIALQFRGVEIPNQLAQYGQLAQIQQAQQANALRGMQMRELEEGIARRNRLTAQLGAPEFAALKPEEQIGALTRGGFLTEARSLAESQAKVGKEQREAEKSIVDIAAANMKSARDLLPAVKANPAAWDAWRADTIQKLPGLASIIPQQYSSQAADALMLEADKALEKHFVTQNLGGTERVLAMPKYGTGAAAVVPGSAAAVQPLPADVEAQKVRIAQAGRSMTNINMPAQEKAFESELGKGQAERLLKSKVAAEDAAQILQTNQVGRDILKSGAITGAGANFFVGLNNALKQGGVDFGYADAAANSQAYAANMAQNVGKLIKQYGAGTGLSDADRDFATQAAGGKITLDEKAIRKILDINDRAANNVIDKHNKDVRGVKTNIPLTVEKPTFERAAPSPAAQIPTDRAPAAAPMYARNPQTGQRIMSVDGGNTWTPAR